MRITDLVAIIRATLIRAVFLIIGADCAISADFLIISVTLVSTTLALARTFLFPSTAL